MNNLKLQYMNWKMQHEEFESADIKEITFSYNDINVEANFKFDISKLINKINKDDLSKSIIASKISDAKFLEVYDLLIFIRVFNCHTLYELIEELKFYRNHKVFYSHVYDIVKQVNHLNKNTCYKLILAENVGGTYYFNAVDIIPHLLTTSLFKYIAFKR
jgi:hypothetical protein